MPGTVAEPRQKVLIVGAAGFLGRTLCELPFDGLQRIPAVRQLQGPTADGEALALDVTSREQVAAVGIRNLSDTRNLQVAYENTQSPWVQCDYHRRADQGQEQPPRRWPKVS